MTSVPKTKSTSKKKVSKPTKAKAAAGDAATPPSSDMPDHSKDWELPAMEEVLKKYDSINGVHPACSAVPEIDPKGFTELVGAIQKDGLLDAVKINASGELLDGRNRLAACYLLDIEPRIETTEADPWAIATGNVARRHLSVGQRAAFAAERLSHEREAAAKRKAATLMKGKKAPDGISGRHRRGRAAELAGKDVGVSGSSVERFDKLPDRYKKEVAAGKKTIGAATREATGKATKKKPKPKDKPPRQNRNLPEGIEIGYEQGMVTVLCHPASSKQAIIRGPIGSSYLFSLADAKSGFSYRSEKAALTIGSQKLLKSAKEAQPSGQ